MTSHDKSQIQTLLDSNPAFVDEAIRLLGQNQTSDELRVKDTRHHNDIGFSAAHARTGTRLFEFVTGIQTRTGQKKWQPKSLAHPAANRVFGRYIRNHGLNDAVELGRKIALVHWRQLEALKSWNPVSIPTPAKKSNQKQRRDTVVVQGAEILGMKGKAVKVLWDSRKVWLPKSQVQVDSATGDITMPRWLARNKKMLSEKPSGDLTGTPFASGFQESKRSMPQAGTWAHTARMMAEGDDSGFDWDAWKDEMKERDL